MKTTSTETSTSTTTGLSVPGNAELLARIHLSAADRYRAEAALLRGEAVADLMLGATPAARPGSAPSEIRRLIPASGRVV
jgi:hypothetical protein